MKKSINLILAVCLLLLSPAFLFGADVATFTLKNTSSFNRVNELTEVSVTGTFNFSALALYDASNTSIPYQVLPTGNIVFQATVNAKSTAIYALRDGIPATATTLTYAAQKMTTTRNDIAWENDLSAYRMYSSVLLASEPITANGVDVWYKKKSEPVIDKMYTYINYHNEGAEGVDAYSVNGKTLGDGGVAAYVNGKLWLHDPYNTCEIVSNGALRSEFILTYNNVLIDGDYYKKTVRITTDANGLLNKAVVRFEGKVKPMKIAAGIYLHTNMGYTTNGVTYQSEKNIIGYAEDKSEGTVTSANARMYTAVYMAGETTTTEIENHLCLMSDYVVGTDFTYYFGAGWNIFPVGKYTADYDWFDALSKFKQSVSNPLAQTYMIAPDKSTVIDIIYKTNKYWQGSNPIHGNSFWNRAVYHTGNMAAYAVTQEKTFLDFSKAWAETNQWKGAKSTNTANWKYTYGETDDYVLFGDYQVCFQVYVDLYNAEPSDYKIARAKEVMEYEMSTTNTDYWWWADGLYMVMPVMSRLNKITKNDLYLEKLHQYWTYANSIMYDSDAGLYYRDAKYVYPAHKTLNGLKDFWARGDGWVFAALARTLNDLPATDKYRAEYVERFLTMAKAIAAVQQTEGYWTRSMFDPNQAPGYETSGTALFTYGFLWGINNGLLSKKDYGTVVEKAWNYLTTIAVQPNGMVGYVQPIGENSSPNQVVSATSTADFGVGAFLLAASEMHKAANEDLKTKIRLSAFSIENRQRIKVTFSEVLNPISASQISNYTIDNQTLEGTVSFDGSKEITIDLKNQLDYGIYTFAVQGLTGNKGAEIEINCQKKFSLAVPLETLSTPITVTAIGFQTGNTPENTLDNSLTTRWSQAGIGQWIKYDVGSLVNIWAVDIAFYLGDQRFCYFDIQVSSDDITYTTILGGGVSTGLTAQLERYAFNPQYARYVKIVCNGNSTGGQNWNSITEARIRYNRVPTLPAPSNFVATAINSNSIRLSWDSSIEIFSYNITRSTSSIAEFTTIATNIVGTTYIDNMVSENSNYYYRIIPINEIGESNFYAQTNASTPMRTPVSVLETTDAIFHVYPNPFEDNLTLSIENQGFKFVQLYSITGQIVFSKPISEKQTVLSLKDLPSGVYLLKLNSRGKSFSKIVIKK